MMLKLNGLAVDCVIGERPDERTCLQRLMLDVALEITPAAVETDNLQDTVDYAALSEKIRAALVEAKCRMIERAAKVAYDICCAERGVAAARVAVTKAGAIAGLESAEVVYDGR